MLRKMFFCKNVGTFVHTQISLKLMLLVFFLLIFSFFRKYLGNKDNYTVRGVQGYKFKQFFLVFLINENNK